MTILIIQLKKSLITEKSTQPLKFGYNCNEENTTFCKMSYSLGMCLMHWVKFLTDYETVDGYLLLKAYLCVFGVGDEPFHC
jgi:hypothetical protein